MGSAWTKEECTYDSVERFDIFKKQWTQVKLQKSYCFRWNFKEKSLFVTFFSQVNDWKNFHCKNVVCTIIDFLQGCERNQDIYLFSFSKGMYKNWVKNYLQNFFWNSCSFSFQMRKSRVGKLNITYVFWISAAPFYAEFPLSQDKKDGNFKKNLCHSLPCFSTYPRVYPRALVLAKYVCYMMWAICILNVYLYGLYSELKLMWQKSCVVSTKILKFCKGKHH